MNKVIYKIVKNYPCFAKYQQQKFPVIASRNISEQIYYMFFKNQIIWALFLREN
jgi:hypothetical protein